MSHSKSIIFVCMGNICRSPTGEGVFESYVRENHPDEKIRVDSAGTIGYHTGAPADSRMQAAARKRGYNLKSKARKVSKEDFDRFDMIVAMDQENYLDLKQLARNKDDLEKLFLFCDFIPGKEGQSVPDPYYGETDGFELVLDLIESGCPGLYKKLSEI